MGIDTQEYGIFILIRSSYSVLISFVLTGLLLVKFHQHNMDRISCSIKCYSLSFIIIFGFSSLFTFILSVYGVSHNFNESNELMEQQVSKNYWDKFHIIMVVRMVFYLVSQIFMNLCFDLLILSRFHLAFKNTTYAVKNSCLNIFYGFISFTFISFMVILIILCIKRENVNIIAIVSACVGITFVRLIYLIVITVLLCNKLISVLIKSNQLGRTINDNNADNVDDNDIINDEIKYNIQGQNKTILEVITKTSLLNLLSILTYNIYGIASPIIGLILYKNMDKNDEITAEPAINEDKSDSILCTWIFAIIIWIQEICIVLSFNFNQNYYYKLCGLCHNCLYKCCLKCVKLKVPTLNIDDRKQPLLNESML